MPIFEYRCQACEHLEEVLQKHTDPAPAKCPACGKEGTLAKEISMTSFQLKGGGWYKDLYASSSSSSSSKGESKSESKSETKKTDTSGGSSGGSSSGSSGGGSAGGSSGGSSASSSSSAAA